RSSRTGTSKFMVVSSAHILFRFGGGLPETSDRSPQRAGWAPATVITSPGQGVFRSYPAITAELGSRHPTATGAAWRSRNSHPTHTEAVPKTSRRRRQPARGENPDHRTRRGPGAALRRGDARPRARPGP